MHAEILKGTGKQPWRWNLVNKGRVTANNETFPTKGNAVRAVKSVIKAVVKELYGYPVAIKFTLTADKKRQDVFILKWADTLACD